MNIKHKKLALSLSGGGAKAFAYLGFIKAIKEAAIEFQFISAHSGGAMLLCYMNSGLNDDEILKLAEKFRLSKFFSLNPYKNHGLIDLKKLEKYLNEIAKNKNIENTDYKSVVVVSDLTDFNKPQKLNMEEGNLAKFSTASKAIPPLFPLMRHEGRLLGDGAYTSLFNASELRKHGAEYIIGLYPDALQHTKIPRLFNDQARMVKSILSAREVYERQQEPIELEVRDFDYPIGLNEYSKVKYIYESGYRKGQSLIERIKAELKD